MLLFRRLLGLGYFEEEFGGKVFLGTDLSGMSYGNFE